MIIRIVCSLALLVTVGTECLSHARAAQDEPSPEAIAFFETKIRPVLVESCYRCHSADADQIRGGLAVDTQDALHLGGDSGPAIVPGDLDESLLWDAINYYSYEMPPNRPLPEEVIADFKTWIEMGAPDPRVASGPVVINSQVSEEDIAEGREFWAFSPPEADFPPRVADPSWPKTDIDRFVLAELEAKQLEPSPDAGATTLLRRLCFDLTGLPPTDSQKDKFLRAYDRDQDRAVESLVDELLATPQYGERWGRHWLDVARFAESSGKELNATFPHAWRYRDYVIDSFNEDKPYDRFIQEQVAGDLLPAPTDEEWAENLVATGFLAIGTKSLTERDPRQFAVDLADEQIDTTTRVILGVSVACARCHDHKFDPIPQTDYYAIAGIFKSTETYYGTIDNQQNRRPTNLIISPVSDPSPFDRRISKSELADLQQRLDDTRAEYQEIQRLRRLANSPRAQNIPNVPKPNDPRISVRNIATTSVRVGLLTEQVHSVDETGEPKTFFMGVQPSDRPSNARVLVRGEVDQPAQEVPRGFVQVLDHGEQSISKDSTGRLELARWMTSRRNPLTARVMVNRIWQHLLGEGIVNTPENFGSSGQAPTHPQLLDYMAVQFMENGWSVKTMIREIATSRTYRMSTKFDQAAFEIDPNNRLLWRANTRRLDAEEIRDAMMAISGDLEIEPPRASSVARLGHAIANARLLAALEARERLSNARRRGNRDRVGGFELPGEPVGDDLFNEDQHRSVYLPVIRDQIPHSLQLFDFAEASMVVGKRDESNTPSQALYLLNSDFVISQSDRLSQRIVNRATQLDEQVALAFEAIYNRAPTDEERQLAIEYCREVSRGESPRRRSPNAIALSELCQALFASAEFRYLD